MPKSLVGLVAFLCLSLSVAGCGDGSKASDTRPRGSGHPPKADIAYEWGPHADEWPDVHMTLHVSRRLEDWQRDALRGLIASCYDVGSYGGYDGGETHLSFLDEIRFKDRDPSNRRVEWYVDMGTTGTERPYALGELLFLLEEWSKWTGDLNRPQVKIELLIVGT